MKLKEKENILMHKKTFDVFYLGNIEKIAMGNSQKRDTEAQLIDRIEEAQVTKSCVKFSLSLSNRVIFL